ncbi:MAG: hypothetical protein VXW49_15570 [Pseudomonadota bacterium]|nr:hypothetical protein [Pseudomonadota bacterium]
MFGFGKILVLAVIIAAVWYGFKFVGRLQANRQVELEDARPEGNSTDAGDMVKCPQCAAFVVAGGAAKCSKSECPY